MPFAHFFGSARLGMANATQSDRVEAHPHLQEIGPMRSERIFGTMTYISNRYLLAMLVAKATRKLHKPNTRIQEGINDVLERFSQANPIADAAPVHLPAPRKMPNAAWFGSFGDKSNLRTIHGYRTL